MAANKANANGLGIGDVVEITDTSDNAGKQGRIVKIETNRTLWLHTDMTTVMETSVDKLFVLVTPDMKVISVKVEQITKI